MKTEEINELKNLGYVILRNQIDNKWLSSLFDELTKVFDLHRKIQISKNNDIKTDGVALNILQDSPIFISFLEYFLSKNIIDELETNFFYSKTIINSFSAINNLPNQKNFSSKIHRDIRFYSHGMPMMVNFLFMIDDFTIENGATFILPYSHLKEEMPSEESFFQNAVQATGNRGDILIFDSNLWHCSAPNYSKNGRVGLPMTVSRSFMKQLYDYPRAVGYEKMEQFDQKLQAFLGYHSRVPASMEEWYMPEEKRFYKKNQD